MKTLIRTLAVITCIWYLAQNSLAQNSTTEGLCEEIVVAETHWVKPYNGVNYLCWTVVEKHAGSIYLIERSVGTETWEVIGFKDAFQSPGNVALAYYYTDEKPLPGKNTYRLKRISLKESIYSSYDQVEIYPIEVAKP